MARTAPTVDGSGDFKLVSIHLIDASGDVRSDSIQVPFSATNAQIEAVVDAYNALTNASIYKIEVSEVYNSVADKSDAVDQPKDSVFDNFVFLFKDSMNNSKRGFVVAPVGDAFVSGTDQVDPTNTDIAAYITAMLALIAGTYSLTQIRYTERREINEAVKV